MIVKNGNNYEWIPLRKIPAEVWNAYTIEQKASEYSEEYGICEYHIKNGKMIYYTSFPLEHITYKVTVNLALIKEFRTPLRGYYKSYKSLVGGKYQSNYMV